MNGLSEKAKGKQRAIDVSVATGSSRRAEEVQSRELIVRFTNGQQDLATTIGSTDSVRDVKRHIKQEIPALARRRLRLIHAGRILTDSMRLFQALRLQEQRWTGKALSEAEGGAVENNAGALEPTWLHCSIGAEMTDGEAEAEDAKMQTVQLKPIRGFDRLASAGFSEAEIADFRRTFHSQSSGDFLDEQEPGDDEDYDEHARGLEEQWIDSLDNAGTAALAPSSTSTSIIRGLLIGFFFPLIPFFFLREGQPAVFWDGGQEQDRPRTTVFSNRTQMALVLGFMVNVTFGMWRYLLTS